MGEGVIRRMVDDIAAGRLTPEDVVAAEVMDYSQSGEQAHVLAHARELAPGRFLDIGAGDGVTYSNTRALAMAGWGGVCVEPAAWAFERLVALYADRHDIDCVQAVVTGDDVGLVPWFYSRDDHLSTVERSEADKWPQVPFRRTYAAAVDLRRVLDYCEGFSINVVSIDAEGLTGELVKAYARTQYWDEVQLIVFEHVQRRLAGHLTLVPPFELVAETSNNVIYRRR